MGRNAEFLKGSPAVLEETDSLGRCQEALSKAASNAAVLASTWKQSDVHDHTHT